MNMNKETKGETKRKRSRRKRRSNLMRNFSPLSKYNYVTAWTAPGLSSNSSGVIASTIGASIASSYEYTALQAIYTEVRLIRLTMTLSPIQQTNTTVSHGRIRIGTNILMNSSTFTTPTAYSSVDNTSKVRTALTYLTEPMIYDMVVPRDLEFANLVADAPTTVTPWAGSPGVIQLYGGGLNVSTNYFFVDIRAWFQLRGRQ